MRETPSYRLIAAGLIIVAYFTLAGLLLWRALGSSQPIADWEQVLVIFNAIGALATTASGILFGAEIQQANVRGAQQDSLRQAADAARMREAAILALDALEPGAAASASGHDGSSRARAILQRTLATPA